MQTGIRKCVVCVLLSLTVFVMSPAAYSQPAEADVFGVIKITDPEGLVGKIGQLVDHVEPGMGMMVNGMVMGQLQMLLKNPQWVGVDKVGEFSIVVLNPMTHPSPVALVLPLTSEADFVGVMKQNMTGGEDVDGVLSFESNGMSLFFAGAGNMGVLADNADMVAAVKDLIEADAPILKDAPVAKGQITASVAFSKIMTELAPMIEGFSQMAMMGMMQDEATAGMADVLQAEMNTVIDLLQQTDTLELGITVDPDAGVRLMEAVKAVPGSAMANFFAAQAPAKSDLLGFLPADAAVVSSGVIAYTPEFIEGYANFSKAISLAASPEDAAGADRMAEYVKEMMLTTDGSFAFSMFSPSQTSLVSAVSGLTDPARYKAMLQQYPEMFQGLFGLYEDMGMEFDVQVTAPEAYKSGEILTMDFGFGADSIPDPEGQEVFKQIFGDQMAMEMGFVGNYAVISMGRDGRSQVEALLDAVASGQRGAVAMSPASFGLAEAHNFFLGISVPNILKWMADYVPETPEFDVAAGPGLGMGAHFTGSHAIGELVVPLDEILAIKDVIMLVQTVGGEWDDDEWDDDEWDDDDGDDDDDDDDDDGDDDDE
jgi:hypothetical protein